MEPIKRGYLHQDFRFFHLKDRKQEQYEYHYHEFNKIVLLLSGKVTYMVEGKTYFLQPWDILLVNHHDIHRPVIEGDTDYERIVIWISPDYIRQLSRDGDDLSLCFSLTGEKRLHLIRPGAEVRDKLRELLKGLEGATVGEEYGSSQLAKACLIQLLVYLGRLQLGKPMERSDDVIKCDPKIEVLLRFINEHLGEDLTIDGLAKQCYVSRFYLMHRFKEETGYTIYNYLMQKRLLLAKEQLRRGVGASTAAQKSGFRDYSAFLRAFKKNFGMTPTEYMASDEQELDEIQRADS